MKGKKEKSEQARRDAVNERIQAQLKSKQIVQKALKACLDGKEAPSNPNHIVFESSDEEDDKKNFDELLGFEEEDDDNDGAFAVKSQFEGKKGLKLMKMQQQIGNDPRFQVDERFADEEEDDEEEDNEQEEDVSDELKRNLDILEQVVGPKKMKGKRSVQFVDMNQRRYNPSIADHEKFIIKPAAAADKPPKKKKKKTASELPAPPVSEERFYEVQYDKLKEAFGSKEEESESEAKPFSMASLFSIPKEDEAEKPEVAADMDNEESDYLPHFSHFEEDSSSGSEIDEDYGNRREDEKPEGEVVTSSTTPRVVTAPSNKTNTKHDVMLQEMRRLSQSWTLFPTQQRLEEVKIFAATFPPKLTYEEKYEKWLQGKDTLREDYKKKHRDYIRAKKRHSKTQDENQDDSLGGSI